MERFSPPPLARENIEGTLCLTGFGRPFGFGRDGDGNLLIADMDLHAICRITPELDGSAWLHSDEGWSQITPIKHGATSRMPARPPGRFNGPHSVATGEDGRLYVTTYYAPALHIVPPDGTRGPTISRISGDKALKGPATTHLLEGKHLLVAEYALHGVFAFDTDGRFQWSLGGGQRGFGKAAAFAPGSGPACFDRPHMCRPALAGLMVVDTWNHRLQYFSPEGHVFGVLGATGGGWRDPADSTPAGAAPGSFQAPVAVGQCADGRFVVTDWGNNRLQWFDVEGNFLSANEDLGLEKPYDAQVFGTRCFVANSHKGTVIVLEL